MHRNDEGIADIAIILIVLAVIGVVAYLMLRGGQIKQQKTATETTSLNSESVPQNPDENFTRHECEDTEIYTNTGLGVAFNCLRGYEVVDHGDVIGISPSSADSNLVRNNNLDIRTIESLNESDQKRNMEYLQLSIGESYFDETLDKVDPDVSEDIKHSLTRLENTTISGKQFHVYENLYPYEGVPYRQYILPEGDYLIIRLNSEHLSPEVSSTESSNVYNDLNQILSTFQFIDEHSPSVNSGEGG